MGTPVEDKLFPRANIILLKIRVEIFITRTDNRFPDNLFLLDDLGLPLRAHRSVICTSMI